MKNNFFFFFFSAQDFPVLRVSQVNLEFMDPKVKLVHLVQLALLVLLVNLDLQVIEVFQDSWVYKESQVSEIKFACIAFYI